MSAPQKSAATQPAPTQPESLDDFYARIVAAADADGRLAVNTDAMPGWDIYPYERESLQMRPVHPPMDVEPPRRGENPSECWCADGDFRPYEHRLWRNERWCLDMVDDCGLPIMVLLKPLEHCDLPTMSAQTAAEFGPLIATVASAIEALPSVGRAQMAKYGDGGAHMHIFLFGRPARMGQFRGSPLLDWEENLPRVPIEVLRANARPVAQAMVDAHGGTALI